MLGTGDMRVTRHTDGEWETLTVFRRRFLAHGLTEMRLAHGTRGLHRSLAGHLRDQVRQGDHIGCVIDNWHGLWYTDLRRHGRTKGHLDLLCFCGSGTWCLLGRSRAIFLGSALLPLLALLAHVIAHLVDASDGIFAIARILERNLR